MSLKIETAEQAEQVRQGIRDAIALAIKAAEAKVTALAKREADQLAKSERKVCPGTGKPHAKDVRFCTDCFKPVEKSEGSLMKRMGRLTKKEGRLTKKEGRDEYGEWAAKEAAKGVPDKKKLQKMVPDMGTAGGAPTPQAPAPMAMSAGPIPGMESEPGPSDVDPGPSDESRHAEGRLLDHAESCKQCGGGQRPCQTGMTLGRAWQSLQKGGLEKAGASPEGLPLAGAKIPPPMPGKAKTKLPGMTAPSGSVARANQGLSGFKSIASTGSSAITAPKAGKTISFTSLAGGMHKSEDLEKCVVCKSEEHVGSCGPNGGLEKAEGQKCPSCGGLGAEKKYIGNQGTYRYCSGCKETFGGEETKAKKALVAGAARGDRGEAFDNSKLGKSETFGQCVLCRSAEHSGSCNK